MAVSNNQFGLFGSAIRPTTLRNPPTNNAALAEIDDFVEAHHQKLMKKADTVVRARLLRSFHQAKPPTTEKYLAQFIKDFAKDPAFAETIELYRQKLAVYQQAKVKAAESSLAASRQMLEAPKLTPQELDWQQLLETLKRCVNNRSTRNSLSWHPRHNENYYLAKLRVQWQHYETNYGAVVLDNFATTLAYEIAEDHRQTVVSKHLEAEQDLMTNKMKYSPTRLANQHTRLEREKENDLLEINTLAPQFSEYAEEVIRFVMSPPSNEVKEVFDEAMMEAQRQEHTVANNPALFKLKMSTRHRNHTLATLDKIDESREMQVYREIFANESVRIQAALDEQMAFD